MTDENKTCESTSYNMHRCGLPNIPHIFIIAQFASTQSTLPSTQCNSLAKHTCNVQILVIFNNVYQTFGTKKQTQKV